MTTFPPLNPPESEQAFRENVAYLGQVREQWHQHTNSQIGETNKRLSGGLEQLTWVEGAFSADEAHHGRTLIRLGNADYGAATPKAQAYVPGPWLEPALGNTFVVYDRSDQGSSAAALLRLLVARSLQAMPPGDLRLALIDNQRLGEQVAAFARLGTVRDELIHRSAATSKERTVALLKEITTTVATVHGQFLRGRYPDLRAYNAAVPDAPEPYHLVVVVGFPHGFDASSAAALASLAQAGRESGIYVRATVDLSAKLPHSFNLSDLLSHGQVLTAIEDGKWWRPISVPVPDDTYVGAFCTPEAVDPETCGALAESIGVLAAARASTAITMERVLDQTPSGHPRSTVDAISAPIGRSGAEPIHFSLGDSPVHALVGGRTGSGKTQLLHSIVNSIAVNHPPEEIRIALVDMKQGVEFIEYAGGEGAPHLPHAEVVATDADAEYAISVLMRALQEIEERSEIFKQAGATGIASYRRAHPDVQLPRKLIVIDEFQNLFLDEGGEDAWALLNRLAREGRAYGIHLLLASQSLSGLQSASIGVRTSTFNQFGLRIGLQMSAEDSTMILGEKNTAAATLERVGSGIYNPRGGELSANTFFQSAYSDSSWRSEVRDQLAEQYRTPAPFVFRGDQPATWEAEAQGERNPAVCRVGVGKPVAIARSVHVDLYPDRGRNLVIIGRDESVAIRLLGAMAASIGQTYDPDAAELLICDLVPRNSPNTGYGERLASRVPGARHLAGVRAFETELESLVPRLEAREPLDRRVFVVALGLHRTRWEASSSFRSTEAGPFERLEQLLTDGSELGAHLLGWSDVAGSLGTKLMRPFGLRVLLPDAAPDSLDLTRRRLQLRDNRIAVWDQDDPTVLTKAIPYRYEP